MSDFSLTLGPVAFAGFELPSSITIGGQQRLAIHRLPGGIRIIDALGPDPSGIAFSGIFTGPDAADRARTLDDIRIAGASLTLAWDAFLYTVILERFEADYRSPWWIPYRISCSVLQDAGAPAAGQPAGLYSDVTADIAAAGTLAAPVSAALAVPGATTAGTAAYATARTGLSAAITAVDVRITQAQGGLDSPNLGTTVTASGLLAQLAASRAYMARAARALASAGT